MNLVCHLTLCPELFLGLEVEDFVVCGLLPVFFSLGASLPTVVLLFLGVLSDFIDVGFIFPEPTSFL
ncbi:MAG: hypothetical protein IPH89_04100 [Bacteroidetes bacterium]|nr:hypothetical protein [Bacteroidota bacterium]